MFFPIQDDGTNMQVTSDKEWNHSAHCDYIRMSNVTFCDHMQNISNVSINIVRKTGGQR